MRTRLHPRRPFTAAALVAVVFSISVGPSATSAPEQALRIREGTFAVKLREHGRVVGLLRFRMRVTTSKTGFDVQASPKQGWLELPAGRWYLATTIRAPWQDSLERDLHFWGSHPTVVTRAKARVPLKVFPPGIFLPGTFEDGVGGNGPLGSPAILGRRVAYGLVATQEPTQKARRYRRLFATIAWPSFKLLGVNVPVDPKQPHGGIG